MAHFYADVRGQSGTASRIGSKDSGINGHIRGWDLGVKVFGHVDEDGEDVFSIYLTGGSHGFIHDKMLGTFKRKDLE